MAWENTEWACGHHGEMQLYGPGAGRKSRIAYEAGRKCMVCWLLDRWENEGDPRRGRKDLAKAIAKGKNIIVRLSEEELAAPVVRDECILSDEDMAGFSMEPKPLC